MTTNEKNVPMKPKQGFIAAAVREFYTDLSKVKHDNPNLLKALKFAKRCYQKYLANESEEEEPPKKRYPTPPLIRFYEFSRPPSLLRPASSILDRRV